MRKALIFEEQDGPLPFFLILFTLDTGMVDALSFLRLNEVFVANMTGNIVMLGFDIGGMKGISALTHVTALAAFVIGATTGGKLAATFGAHRGRLVALLAASKIILGSGAAAVALLVPHVEATSFRYALIVLLALSMGLQNAGIRRLGMPDLTTTVLTGTITALSADLAVAPGLTRQQARRILSALLLFLGAAAGALLLQVGGIATVVLVNLGLLVCIASGAFRSWSSQAPWTGQAARG